MSKSIKEIVKDIQYKTDLTLDQIADQAGYSRGYFRNEVSKNTSKTIRDGLLAKFNEIIEQNVPAETTAKDAPVSELQAVAGAKSYSLDKYIMLLEDSLKEKKDQLKEVQARLTDLEGRQRDFLAKVENSIERYEHLVLTQLQNGKAKVPEDSTPIVHERSYKSQGKKL